MKTKTDFIEVVSDIELRKKEKQVTEAVRGFYPECGPVKLYRTADGRVGFRMQVTLTPENRKQVDKVYRAVTRCLGEKRGRPIGAETVQTKLHLLKPVYSALKKAAEDSGETMSCVVTESLLAQFGRRQRSALPRKKPMAALRLQLQELEMNTRNPQEVKQAILQEVAASKLDLRRPENAFIVANFTAQADQRGPLLKAFGDLANAEQYALAIDTGRTDIYIMSANPQHGLQKLLDRKLKFVE